MQQIKLINAYPRLFVLTLVFALVACDSADKEPAVKEPAGREQVAKAPADKA